jgi:butyryl-CoA dehydrogenase
VCSSDLAAIASAAYHYSLQYAKERPQGRQILEKDPLKPQIPIIQHADVRRMLLAQKCFVEGSFSLVTECLRLVDLESITEGEEQQKVRLLLELLTPIVKTYPSEEGIRSVSLALQVFGGYGYTMDFDAQQYYRDVRIMAIYEGTTGIQSLDLLGRKVSMESGKALEYLAKEIHSVIEIAEGYDALRTHSASLQSALGTWQSVLSYLIGFAAKGQADRYLADANAFLELSSLVVMGWQWLKIGIVASQKTSEGAALTENFYRSKLTSMKYFFKYELPRIHGLEMTLKHPDSLTIYDGHEDLFS